MQAKNRLPPLTEMPEPLVATAFVNGDEAAWEQSRCGEVIAWLHDNGYAILGIELWLLKDGTISTFINTSSGQVLFCTSCDPVRNEYWDDYVRRSAQLATENIAAFRWPEDALETYRPYFNLSWADRKWFQSRNEFLES
jgi:hypothetical protein